MKQTLFSHHKCTQTGEKEFAYELLENGKYESDMYGVRIKTEFVGLSAPNWMFDAGRAVHFFGRMTFCGDDIWALKLNMRKFIFASDFKAEMMATCTKKVEF